MGRGGAVLNRRMWKQDIVRTECEFGDQYLKKNYRQIKRIGTGGYGLVIMAQDRRSGRLVAIKSIQKDLLIQRKQTANIVAEKEALCVGLDHPFIVNIIAAVQTPADVHFVLDYCPAGDLFSRICAANPMPEATAAFYLAEVFLALKHLHSHHIAHCDIKPENIMIDAQGHISLIDFGLARTFSTLSDSFCGSEDYMAPEILEPGSCFDQRVDFWAIGCLIYELLTSFPPFYHLGDKKKLYHSILFSDVVFPRSMSIAAKDLIGKLLIKVPDARLCSFEEIEAHPFFHHIDWNGLLSRRVQPPFRPNLQNRFDTKYFTTTSVHLRAERQDEGVETIFCHELIGFTYVKQK